jgi:hypothetical protein
MSDTLVLADKKASEEHPYGFKCAVCEGKVVSRNRGKQPCFECENGHLCDDGIHVESGELRVYDEKANGSLKHGVMHVEDARNEDPEEIKNRKQRRLDCMARMDKKASETGTDFERPSYLAHLVGTPRAHRLTWQAIEELKRRGENVNLLSDPLTGRVLMPLAAGALGGVAGHRMAGKPGMLGGAAVAWLIPHLAAAYDARQAVNRATMLVEKDQQAAKRKSAKLEMTRDVLQEVTGGRPYSLGYFTGEFGELMDEVKNRDWEAIKDEASDTAYGANMLAHQATGINFPMIGGHNALKKFRQRNGVWRRTMERRGVPFSVDYLVGGSNFAKPHKIQQAFELAGVRLDGIEAQTLSQDMQRELAEEEAFAPVRERLEEQQKQANAYRRLFVSLMKDVAEGRSMWHGTNPYGLRGIISSKNLRNADDFRPVMTRVLPSYIHDKGGVIALDSRTLGLPKPVERMTSFVKAYPINNGAGDYNGIRTATAPALAPTEPLAVVRGTVRYLEGVPKTVARSLGARSIPAGFSKKISEISRVSEDAHRGLLSVADAQRAIRQVFYPDPVRTQGALAGLWKRFTDFSQNLMKRSSAMHTAKRLSDKKRWAGKHAILIADMAENPDAWKIDSRDGKFVGLTRSDGWRFHMPASKVPATIIDKTQMLDSEKQAGYSPAMEGYFSRMMKRAEDDKWDRAYEPGDEGNIDEVRDRVAARDALKAESDALEKAHRERPTSADYSKIPGQVAELGGQFKGYSLPYAGAAQLAATGLGFAGHGLANINLIGQANALKNVKDYENTSWWDRFGTVAHDNVTVPINNAAKSLWDRTMGDSKKPLARDERIGPALYKRPSNTWYSDTVQGIRRDDMAESEKAVTNDGKNWLGNDSFIPSYLRGIVAGGHHAGSTMNYGGMNLWDSFKGDEWTTQKPKFWTPPEAE